MSVKKSKNAPANANPYGQYPSSNREVQNLLAAVDEVAYGMEVKWGCGVLPRLVDQPTHDKFMRVVDKLNDAIETNDYDTVKTHSENLIRGWRKLDELATAAGHDKDPVYYEIISTSGVAYWIVQDSITAARLMARHPHKASAIMLGCSVADLLTSRLSVTAQRQTNASDVLRPSVVSLDELLEDEIPW